MKVARVAGTVVSTINHPLFEERKLLLCDYLTPDGNPTGGYTIAIDLVDAGVGERVLVLDEGNSARQLVNWKDGPIRAVVVGIVDDVTLAPPNS